MPSRRRPMPVAALVVVALLITACSAQPVSEVVDAPGTGAATQAASAAGSPGPASPLPSHDPASPSPTTTSAAAPASAPPSRPTGTTFAIVSEEPAVGGGVKQTHRITWDAPAGEATAFLVYGVKDCLRAAKKTNGTPCVVKGMRIPRDGLDSLGQANGSDRSIDVSWVVPASGAQPYAAVLLRATNAAGDSIFTIVHSEDVCWQC